MAESNGGQQDDTVMLLLLLAGASGLGLFSLGAMLAPVQAWLVEVNVLAQGDSVILGWGEGQQVGLDAGRLAIAVGVVLLLLVIAAAVVRNRVRRDV